MIRARLRKRARGSTVVEVLMAIAVLAVGASGIMALQKATAVANREAKNLEIANEIGRTWVERVRGDALLWNHPSPFEPNSDLLTDTLWIRDNVKDPGSATWFRPTNAPMGIYGVHDAFGVDDPNAIGASADGPFCVNMRLSWLRADQRLIRVELRVYWLRRGIQDYETLSMTPVPPLCGDDPSGPPDVNGHPDVFHVIHLTTAVAQNMAR